MNASHEHGLSYLSHEKPSSSAQSPAWKDLIGLFDDSDSPGDISTRVDDYLAQVAEQNHRDSTRSVDIVSDA